MLMQAVRQAHTRRMPKALTTLPTSCSKPLTDLKRLIYSLLLKLKYIQSLLTPKYAANNDYFLLNSLMINSTPNKAASTPNPTHNHVKDVSKTSKTGTTST